MSEAEKTNKPPVKLTTEQMLESMARRIDEIPEVIIQVFAKYDKTVNQRFETILKSGKAPSGQGGGGDFLKDLLGIINKVTSGEQPTGTQEHSYLANRIVTLSLRKTLNDVEKSVGAASHVTLSDH